MPYTIIKQIGNGGMGCVYKAKDPQGRIVALKMMSNKVTCYPEYRQLFQSEVDTLKLMDHPSVVHIVGDPYKDDAGNLYLPMEYVEGETLEQRVNRCGVFPMDEAVNIMCKILEALQYVHDRKRIHRDIKPSNIMLRPDGSVCIIDFGIAKDAKIGSGHTVGHIIGTDGYMSPEQANGLNIDCRTDIYSLGCVLYYLLTGKHAISKGSNDYETICNILKNVPMLPSQAATGVPTTLDDVFAKAVDKNMTQRYQTAREFRDALEEAVGKCAPKVTIGRQSNNDIVINNSDVSRHHLAIKGVESPLTGGESRFQLVITDLGSTNGTGLDGRLLRGDSMSLDYNGTMNFPVVMLAGKPELTLNWNEIMSKLRDKGWNPHITNTNVLGDNTNNDSHTTSTTIDDTTDDNLNPILCVVSFLFPIVGWILWGCNHRQYPKKAKTASGLAWVGFAIGFILNIIITLIQMQ